MKKPINILFEVLILTIFVIAGAGYSAFFRQDTSWLLALVLMLYVAGIVSITIRTLLKKQSDRRSVSVFLFGLSCGLCYGILLSFMDQHAENLNFILMLLGICLWGLAGGLIAAFSSYIISLTFIKDLRSFIAREHKK